MNCIFAQMKTDFETKTIVGNCLNFECTDKLGERIKYARFDSYDKHFAIVVAVAVIE